MPLTQEPHALAKTVHKAHMRSTPATKLVSLYLVDAIARHAQEIARRNGVGFAKSDPERLGSSAATFLRELQEPGAQIGIDSLQKAPAEQRDKVLKVMDIWGRAGTFSSKILQRIHEYARDSEPNSVRSTTPPTDPPAMQGGLPANVLALLGQSGSATAAAPAPAAPAGATSPPAVGVPPAVPDLPPVVADLLGMRPAAPRATSPMGAMGAPSPMGAMDARGARSRERGAPERTVRERSPQRSRETRKGREARRSETLRDFDQAQFDPTNSAHWERLSCMWKNTYQVRAQARELTQYEASGPELMMALSALSWERF